MRKFYILLFAISSALISNAQLTGIKTIPGDYPTIAAAVTDLNAQGIGGGGATFNVLSGHTEVTDVPAITATGYSPSEQIIFQKSGAGANPKIIPLSAGTVSSSTTAGAHGDGIVVINGGDYITFDGIDLQTNPGFTAAGMYEYGYYLKKASGADASKNIVIKNCTITLNKAAVFSFGIFVSNISGTGTATVSSADGRSENIKIYNNTITNVYGGIQLRGFSAASPYEFYDQGIEVGVDGANTITNYGGGGSAAYGIYTIYQNNLKIANNIINGGAGTTTTTYGIFTSTSVNSNIDIYANNITLQTAATTSSVYGINNAGGGSGTDNTINIYNNTVKDVNWTTCTTGDFYGVYNSASGKTVNLYGNNIHDITQAGTSGIIYGVYNSSTAASGIGAVYSNTVRNITGSSSTINCIYSAPVATTTATINDNIVFSVSGSTVYGIRLTTSSSSAYRNKVYDLTSTGSTVYGIYTATATDRTLSLYNNIIGRLYAPAASSTSVSVSGIYLSGTSANSTYNVLYNTVYLDATSSGANFSTSALYHTYSTTATSASLNLQNNILVNTSTPNGSGYTAAFRRSSGTNLNNYNASSDRNIFYAPAQGNAVLYYDGTNAYADVPSFTTAATPRESNSRRELPPFLNSNNGAAADFLHLDPTQPTFAESGGVTISGLEDDFDGDLRPGSGGYIGNGTAPDIGADEFEGNPIQYCSSVPVAGSITGEAMICVGASTVLSLSGQSADQGISYTWKSSTVSGGPYTPTGGTGTAFSTGVLTQPTYFIVEVTCSLTGQKVETQEFSVNFFAKPNVTVSPASINVCSGSVQPLTAAGASTYTWSPVTNLYLNPEATTTYSTGTNATTVYTRPTLNRTYTVTGTDANGCVDTAIATVYFVAGVGTVKATAASTKICQNGSTQLNATAPAYTSYSVSPITYNPIPLPSGGVSVLVEGGVLMDGSIKGTLDDGNWDSIPLPFTFNFYGTNYDQFHISTNGFLSFSTFNLTSWASQTIPSTTDPDNGIHIIHTDLDLNDSASLNGRIEYFEDGVAPNRRFVINYVNVGFFGLTANPGTVTVQIILHEGTNKIEIHNTNVSNTSVNKTQGVEGPSGSIATAVPGRNATKQWSSMPDAYIFEPISLTYTWSPATYLDNPSIQNPVASNMLSSVTYYLTTSDAYTGCSAKDSIEIIAGAVLTATTNVAPISVCAGSSVDFVALPSGGGTPYVYSWSDGSTIVSTDSSFSAIPGLTTTYTLTVSDACSQQATTDVTVTVNNPQLVNTIPGTRCGTGSVTLGATGSGASTFNWYENATGGIPVGSGATFNSPSISRTTTYYVTASSGGITTSVGAVTNAQNTGYTLEAGIIFNAITGLTINGVHVYPVGTGAGDVVIGLKNSSGTVISQATVNLVGTAAPGVKTFVPLNFAVPAGNDYSLVMLSRSGGVANLVRDNSGHPGYPYTVPGVISLTAGTCCPTGSNPGSYYFFYDWQVSTGCESAREPVVATVTPVTTLAGTAGGPQVCDVQNVSDNLYTDNACGLIVKVVSSGAAPVSGNVTSCVKIDATVQNYNGNPYVQRHFDIEPATNASTATATVTFYVLQAEFDEYNNNNGTLPELPTGPADNAGIGNLRITQFHGTGTAPGNYTGGGRLLDPVNSNIVWNATSGWWEITVDVTGFSGFYIHTVANGGFPLPANLLTFTGERAGNVNQLKWTVAQEIDVQSYEVERSENGSEWRHIGSVASLGNTSSQRSYGFTDNNISGMKQLYRLRILDKNGSAKLSNIVSISGTRPAVLTVGGLFPNPAAARLNVMVDAPAKDNITIVVMDAIGKVVRTQKAVVEKGSNTLVVDVAGLAQGGYLLKVTCGSNCETVTSKFVKE